MADTTQTHVPRVSIGYPVYNGQLFMQESLGSLLAQDFTDFELFISDNGSCDDTERIGREFAERDPRVTYERNSVNRGLAWNWNNALRPARGEYFKWAAADDLYEPTYLSATVAALDADPTAVLAHSRTVNIDENNQRGDEVLCPVQIDHPDLVTRFYELTHRGWPCVEIFGLIRRDVLLTTRLHGAYPRSDRPLLAELGLHGRLVHVDEVLFLRREFTGRATRTHALKDRYTVYTGAPNRGDERPNWRLHGGFAQALAHADVGLEQRLRCSAQLARVLWQHRRTLADELRA